LKELEDWQKDSRHTATFYIRRLRWQLDLRNCEGTILVPGCGGTIMLWLRRTLVLLGSPELPAIQESLAFNTIHEGRPYCILSQPLRASF